MKKILKRSYNSKDYQLKKFEKLLLKNGSILNFDKKQIIQQDVLISNGKIERVGNINTDNYEGELVDLTNKMIVPGMLDMHVHFREPGREDEETLMTGAAAAMAGGFTGVCTMPNTVPATDNKEIVEFIKEKFKNHLVDVYPIAAITKGRQGDQIVEMAELIDAGVIAFSDDGTSVTNTQVLRRALEYSQMFDVPIIEHSEDKFLFEGGAMHEGFTASKLGLPGIPSIAEEIAVARNIMLAKYTSGKIHLAHISCAGSVELVRHAKEQGIRVTCEATPHHFTLTDEAVVTYDTNMKMNPPLRTRKDVDAIIAGLKDGTIDAIATDHAPHSIEEKEVEFISAPFGIVGLETAIGLAILQLVGENNFSLFKVIELIAVNPYKILGLPVPKIAEGIKANLTILDPDEEWTIDRDRFKSQSRNTPFHGWKVKGKPLGVFNNEFLMINLEQQKKS